MVEKTFVYMTSLTRECRKALTDKFERTYKGMAFDAVEPTMRKEIESWFTERERNIVVKHEKSNTGRPGEVLLTYSGSTKDAHFKFYIDGLFTLAGSSANSPSYLKTMNMRVDKRDFTK
jgi:hypothetical protein